LCTVVLVSIHQQINNNKRIKNLEKCHVCRNARPSPVAADDHRSMIMKSTTFSVRESGIMKTYRNDRTASLIELILNYAEQ